MHSLVSCGYESDLKLHFGLQSPGRGGGGRGGYIVVID